MKCFKTTGHGYILYIGKDIGGEEITEAEYNTILTVIRNKPTATETTDYRLKEDLTWEAYAVDPPDPDPELDESDLLNILLGEGFEI